MATITTTRTSLTDASASAANTITNIKVGGTPYNLNDATARTSITNINTYLGQVATDITAINTESSKNTTAIGSTSDAANSSGSLYARIAAAKSTADANTTKIGSTTDTTDATVYGAINAHTTAVNTAIGDAAGTSTTGSNVYDTIRANAATAAAASKANADKIGTAGDASTANTLYGALKKNEETLASLKTVTSGAFVYIGSVDSVPTGVATDSKYSVSDDGKITFSDAGDKKLAVGNVINVKNAATNNSDGMNYAWNGTSWDALGMSVGAASTTSNGYMTSTQVTNLNKAITAYKAEYKSAGLTLELTPVNG